MAWLDMMAWNIFFFFNYGLNIITRMCGPVKLTPKMTAAEAINGRISFRNF